jgi:SEC-C motif-containing protein
MRSRYTAYATGNVAHVMRTTHPESPHREADARAWAADLRRYCDNVEFLGLTVHSAEEDGDQGRVRFTARWRAGGRDGAIEEHSRFVRIDGRWTYLDGAR